MSIFILILGLLFIIAGVGKRCFSEYNYDKQKEEYEQKHRFNENAEPFKEYNPGKLYFAMILVGFALFIFSFSFTIIPTGYTGVRSTFGQINKNTVSNGFNFKIPFVEKIEKVNNKQQDIVFEDEDVTWNCETLNWTTIFYSNVTVTYQISKEKSPWIYANVTNYDDDLITASLVGSAIKSSSKQLSDVDATNRNKVEKLSRESIQKSLDEKYGQNTIIINKVVIETADFEESYNKAIADKQKSQLAYERQQIENKKNIEKAQADADVKEKEAEGNAKAKRINAQAEADANKLLEKALTDKVLQSKMLDKWNGELPKVSGSGSSILDITSILGK